MRQYSEICVIYESQATHGKNLTVGHHKIKKLKLNAYPQNLNDEIDEENATFSQNGKKASCIMHNAWPSEKVLMLTTRERERHPSHDLI